MKEPDWESIHEMGVIDVIAEAQKHRPPYAHRCPKCGELVSILKKEDRNDNASQ